VFVWPRYILGGLLFGVGMTLASGCGNKTLVRIGGGNLKSVVVFLVMGAGAYLMIYTNFGYHLFLRWMPSLDFSAWGLASQGVDELVGHPLGIAGPAWSRITALIIGAAVLAWVFRSRDFRASLDNQLGGFAVGAAVVGGRRQPQTLPRTNQIARRGDVVPLRQPAVVEAVQPGDGVERVALVHRVHAFADRALRRRPLRPGLKDRAAPVQREQERQQRKNARHHR